METPAQRRPFETVMAVIRATTVLLGIYWLAIFVATHLPGHSLPSVGSDKVYHVVAFGGLGLLLSVVIGLHVREFRTLAIMVLSIALLYALLDEWSQQFVVGRQPDLNDFMADACGALLGLVGYRIVRSLLAGENWLAKQAA